MNSVTMHCRKPTFTDKKKIAYNYSDPRGTLEKLSKLKPLISRNEELYISKEVKDKMLLHQRANHADQKSRARSNDRRKSICVSRPLSLK